jgi:hypothetical protein
MKVWERVLYIELSSKKFKNNIKIGDNVEQNNIIIELVANKYLSSLKDDCIIDIYNLTYSEILKYMVYEYNEVDVYAGYKSSGVHKIFSGKILHISNERESRETNIMRLICVSKLLGIYQTKLNLTLQSGINMYSALNFIISRAGIKNSNVSEQLKRNVLTNVTRAQGKVSSILDMFTSKETDFGVSADASNESIVSIWDLKRTDARVIIIKPESGLLINGYPKLSTDGLKFDSLPVYDFMPGDVLVVDNRLIDMSISSLGEATSAEGVLGRYIDENDKYILFSVSYKLSNGQGQFKCSLHSKSKNLMLNITGGNE